ncbi:MAG: efflux RND transporter periplasmic adaptor subunit [Candidatus Saccharibacteria bacterium]
MAGTDMDLMNPELTQKSWRGPGKIVAGIILLAVCIAGYYIYGSFGQKGASYLTMPVTMGDIVDQVQATGTITPLHEVDLYFKNKGTLKSLNVRNGDAVKAGQILAVQDDAALQASVEQAKSNLMQAEYKLKQAQLENDKLQATADQQKALYLQGGVSEVDYKQAQRDAENAFVSVEAAKASIQTAKAQLVIAQNDLKNAVLAAPFAGIVTQVNGEVGQDTGNTTSSIIHIISNELQIPSMVNEVDVGRVKVGQDVEFTVTSYPNRPFKGKVSRISQQATTTNNVQLYEVDIATNDMSKQLLAGMSVTANIIVDKRQKVVAVPTIAFSYVPTYMSSMRQNSNDSSNRQWSRNSGQTSNRNQGSSEYGGRRVQSNGAQSQSGESDQKGRTRRVIVLENNQPIVTQVQVGLSDGQNTEVISGLSEGDKVVVGTNDSSASSTSSGGNGNSGSQRQGNQRQLNGGRGGGFEFH